MAMDCTYRLRIPHQAGQLAKVATRIAEHGGLIGDVHDDRRRPPRGAARDHRRAARQGPRRASWPSALGELPGVHVVWFHDRAFIAHDGGKLEVAGRRAITHQPGRARRLHARRRARVERDRRVPAARRRFTMIGRSVAICTNGTRVLGPRRHRPGAAHAGDGGQGAVLRAARRHQRGADPDRHQGRRRVRRDGRADRPRVRRHPPRGHLGAGVLRDRAPADRGAAAAGDARRRPRHRGRHLGRRDRRLPPGRTSASTRPSSARSASAPPASGSPR